MDDLDFMREALFEAEKSLALGEIPIGAVVVCNGEIIGRGGNMRANNRSPFMHAEMSAMAAAARMLNSWRFDSCTIYVTLEPCVMCAGAIVQCRMKKIVFGAFDPKAGGVGSLYDIPRDPRMYHRCKVVSGILAEECSAILRKFFDNRRPNQAK